MPAPTAADTIRILVATDNHVGYNERDAIRGDDSWKSFHEIMCLAKDHDVDMVLLAGDLFHDNQPSRKSMYQVMRSLRMNCLGDKPCELEILSDASENFQGAFNHVNYEDPDINVAIPVFSIHGNHDDPSGEGHLAALDILQISGLINYYGRTPESDNIAIKPVLLQKGRTKLALFGMSNVRDERLFRTFRDGKVKFFRPGVQQDEWFNLICVHQNHHAYTETGYLPENFLPDFLDLVIWGHEHECLIEPRYNPEMSFHVMQPGSSVATSLMPGEAVPKHVSILSITGKEFKSQAIRLKTIRPFVMKEIVLAEEKALQKVAKKESNRADITRHLTEIVEGLIESAKLEWLENQELGEDEEDQAVTAPLPLIRLRVEYTAPEGGRFDCENPQRFSNRFLGKVANVNDVIQFYRKKAAGAKRTKVEADLPDASVLAQLALDNVKVDKLVREFLSAQSLTILPQNSFGDAVSQFVDKDDRHAMEVFVNESLSTQVKHLLTGDHDDETLAEAMDDYRSKLEDLFHSGQLRTTGKRVKPKPDTWDSDMDGPWVDDPASKVLSDEDDESKSVTAPSKPASTRGRGRGDRATGTTRKASAPASKTKPAPRSRGKKKFVEQSEDEEDDDVIMIDDDDEEEDSDEALFVQDSRTSSKRPSTRVAPGRKASPPASVKSTAPARRAPAKATASKQTMLNFSQTSATQAAVGRRKAREPSEDEISDDDDAFEPVKRGARR